MDTETPVNHVLPAWDVAAGLTAAVSLLASARKRAITGQGGEIQIPLSNVAFGTLSALGNIGEVSVSGRDRARCGNALYGSFGRDFVTGDGRRLMIAAITRRQWRGLVEVLGLQEYIEALERRYGKNFEKDEGARFVHREELFALVETRIAERQFADLAEIFDRHAVCWGEYQSVREALERDIRLSPVNPLFNEISHPSGETYIAAGFPGVMPSMERGPVRPAPQLGAQTDEILSIDLGLADAEIGRLHDIGIVAGPAKTYA